MILGIWAIISLYAVYRIFQDGPDNGMKDFFETVGVVASGIGTIVLAAFAYKAYGQWEEQEAIKNEHKALVNFRMSAFALMDTVYEILLYVKENQISLSHRNTGDEFLENAYKGLEVLILKYEKEKSLQTSYVISLRHIYLNAGKIEKLNTYSDYVKGINLIFRKWYKDIKRKDSVLKNSSGVSGLENLKSNLDDANYNLALMSSKLEKLTNEKLF